MTVCVKWILGMGAAALVAACQGESVQKSQVANGAVAKATAAPSAATTSACEILTQADAEKALGHAVTRIAANGGPAGSDICQYGYQGERMMDTGQATVTLKPVDLASLRKGVTDQGWAVERISGLGDEAFWSKDAGLYVGKGNRTAIYLAGVGGESDEQNKQRAIALARATSSRL